MSSQSDRPVRIEITVSASQPKLLQGLDIWLGLGLISHTQVKRLSQQYLTCRLPELEIPPPPLLPEATSLRNMEMPIVPAAPPSLLSGMWQSFQDELSVRWLLFLGVFLVVVSSGVLAASQWRNFPPTGQYGVLWAYTVIFWGISVWTGKQDNLQLTTQTLQLISLLLVPVNFWAIDSFGLWRHPGEWVVVGVAAVTLSGITILNQSIGNNSSRLTSPAVLILWLSYLHWGWYWSIFPLFAVYLGVLGTTIFLPQRSVIRGEEIANNSLGLVLPHAPNGSLVVIYALIVLLGRGIFVVNLPIEELGLAIAICGWLLARLGKPGESSPESAAFASKIWDGIGASLLLIGWLVTVGEVFPGQATAVSGLGIVFFSQRLQYYWRRLDLAVIFAIGLQTLFLLWRLLPGELQQIAIAIFTQVTGSTDALLSLALFPYLILWVGLTDWLFRLEKSRLARFGEWLTLWLGVVLSIIATVNPIVRSLNLALSTITLIIVTHRRLPIRVSLVYFSHIIGLLALGSTIDCWFPNLNKTIWAAILITLMVAEWGLSILGMDENHVSISASGSSRLNTAFNRPRDINLSPVQTRLITPQIWYRSCWYMGFVLAGLSYMLLWNERFNYSFSTISNLGQWRLLWLLTPLTLTGVASITGEPRRKQVSWWSVIALIMGQFLTLSIPGVRLISLALATGLMWLNTRYLPQLSAALITIGFGLSYVGMLLWDGMPGLSQLSLADWFLALAIAISILWLLRRLLIQRHGTLAALYAQASDYWAIALCSLELFLLSFHNLASYQQYISGGWQYLTASILISFAILYRWWQQPSDAGVYGISWAIEITIAESIILLNGTTLTLATANIILALLTLFLTDWWLARNTSSLQRQGGRGQGAEFTPRPSSELNSLEILPLIYAVIGIILRWQYFTPNTGFLVLGAALTAIGVGRRHREGKIISYLGIAGISLAWYELVVYQMLQTPGGSLADGFTILALVAAAIAITYRCLAWLWQLRFGNTILNLSITEIATIAHIHWGISSFLIILAGASTLGTTPQLRVVAMAVIWTLASYALLQGRSPENAGNEQIVSATEIWIYAGLTEVAATGIYARLTWTQLSIFDPWRVVIACAIACFLYQLPWRKWGWYPLPWQRYAIVSPLLTVGLNSATISAINLLVVAGFYAWLANRQSNLRWTYLSVFFGDWAMIRWLGNPELTDPLWYASIIGLSLLYIAQFDPDFSGHQQRQTRHQLRLLGSSIIGLVALFSHQETGLIPGMISIIAIFAGLGLKVRAFLFIGTGTFLATGFYQLVVLSFRYPFSKWVIGLILGILFISIAANFERRRAQIIAMVQNWINQLQVWE